MGGVSGEVVAGEVGFERVDVRGVPFNADAVTIAFVSVRMVFQGGSGWGVYATPAEARALAAALVRQADVAEGVTK